MTDGQEHREKLATQREAAIEALNEARISLVAIAQLQTTDPTTRLGALTIPNLRDTLDQIEAIDKVLVKLKQAQGRR